MVSAEVQRVEVRDAVEAKKYSLAIDDEMLLQVLQRGLNDPRVPVGSVMAVQQADNHVLAPDD